MSEVTITLVKGQDSSHMNIEQATEDHITKVIDGFFALSGVSPTSPPPIVKPVVQPIPQETVKQKEKKFYPNKTEESSVKEPVQVVGTSTTGDAVKEVAKHAHNNIQIHGNPTTMEEVYPSNKSDFPTNVPDHVRTGIKKKANEPNRYKCRYKCVKCDKQSNHFIPEGTRTVDCHYCQTALDVKKATPGTQGIQPDKFMNWYVAGNQRPIEDFLYSRPHNLKQ